MDNDKKPSSFKTAATNHSYADPFRNFLKDYEQMVQGGTFHGKDLSLLCKAIWNHMSLDDKRPYMESAQKIKKLREKAASTRSEQAEIECIKKQRATSTITSISVPHGSSEGCGDEGPKQETLGSPSASGFAGPAALPGWGFLGYQTPSPSLSKNAQRVPSPLIDSQMDTSPPVSGEEGDKEPNKEMENAEGAHRNATLFAQAASTRSQQASHLTSNLPKSKPETFGVEGATALPGWGLPDFIMPSPSASNHGHLVPRPDNDEPMDTSPPALVEEATPKRAKENNNCENPDFTRSFPQNERLEYDQSMFPNWKPSIPAKPGMQLPHSLIEAWGSDKQASQGGQKRAWPQEQSHLGNQGPGPVGPQTPGWTTGPSPVMRHGQPWYEAWTPGYPQGGGPKRFKPSNHDGSSMDQGQGHVAPLVPYWSATPASRGTIQQQDLNQGMSDNPSNQGLGHTQLLNHASTCESLRNQGRQIDSPMRPSCQLDTPIYLGQGNVCPAAPPRSQGPTALNNSEGESEQVPILSHPPWYSTFH